MFKRDELNLIEHYCYEDVMATYIIWLYMQFTTAHMPEALFINLKDRALGKLKEIQNSN